MPKAALDLQHATRGKVAVITAFCEQMTRQGAAVVTNTPREFAQFIRGEIDLFGPVVKAATLMSG